MSWMRTECAKLKLQKETFANCICLMDFYYKTVSFNADQFMRKTLCMLIISSKCIESKILYTPTIAKNNNIEVNLMNSTEVQMLIWFKYQVNSYNYIKVISQYMAKWDALVSQSNLKANYLLFFEQSYESFLFYEEFIFLCENYLKEKNNLIKPIVMYLLRYFIMARYDNIHTSHLLNAIFKDIEALQFN